MLYDLFVHKTSTIRVTSLIVILVELAVGRLYPKNNRKLNIDAIKYLPPIVQQLEPGIPEVPMEYEDDDKPSKWPIQCELYSLELLSKFVAYDKAKDTEIPVI